MSGSVYENPLCTRYAGKNMQRIFSDDNRYGIWRRLWLALAKGEKALGLEIPEQMISEMESNLDNIDYETVARREKEVRHDVMAHVYAFGLVAPQADNTSRRHKLLCHGQRRHNHFPRGDA